MSKTMNTKNENLAPIVSIKVIATAVRDEIRKMSDEELVKRVVSSGMIGGKPAPGIVKRAPNEDSLQLENEIVAVLRGFGDSGASSTEVAASLAQHAPERVVDAMKRMAARPDGAARKICRAGESKYTRYGLTRAVARAASRRAHGAA